VIEQIKLELFNINSAKFQETIKLEKVNDILGSQNTIKEDLFTFDLKLNTFQKEMGYKFATYDKVYLENLFIAGVIGENNCQYRNMKEFVLVIIFIIFILTLLIIIPKIY